MDAVDADAVASLHRRVAAAMDVARAGEDGRALPARDGRRIPLAARSTRDVVAEAVAGRARARELVRQAEHVRRESAALLRRPDARPPA